MKTLRIVLITAVATLVAVGGWGRLAPAGSAAAPTVYSRTVAGTDVHSLDPKLQWIFVDGGGATGVFMGSDTNFKFPYLEATIDLPTGAKVTSVAVTYKACATLAAQFVFGSYSPTTRQTVQSAVITAPPTCSPKTFTKTGNPITTVANGRRYALDWTPGGFVSYANSASAQAVLYGATIKYTCTSPCVP